jgi:hypothetical protein
MHDLGSLIVSTGAIDLLAAGESLDDDIFASGADTDALFGAEQLFFGADADLLFGADMADSDLAALSQVISGNSDLADPIDISGALDIIGATTPARRQQALVAAAKKKRLGQLVAAQRRASAKKRLSGLASVGIQPTLAVERGYTKSRVYPFGFLADAPSPAGSPGNVTRRPQTPLKLQRLVIPSVIAPFFWITDVKVGKDSQLVGSDPLPAIVFQENAVAVELKGDTANVGHDVTIAFINISGAAQRFQAVMIGAAVE